MSGYSHLPLEHSAGSQVQPRELAQHKALLGISVDPQDGNRLASYADVGSVCVCVCVCV